MSHFQDTSVQIQNSIHDSANKQDLPYGRWLWTPCVLGVVQPTFSTKQKVWILSKHCHLLFWSTEDLCNRKRIMGSLPLKKMHLKRLNGAPFVMQKQPLTSGYHLCEQAGICINSFKAVDRFLPGNWNPTDWAELPVTGNEKHASRRGDLWKTQLCSSVWSLSWESWEGEKANANW